MKKNLSTSEKILNEKRFNDSADIAGQIYRVLNNVTDSFGKRLADQLESCKTSFSLSDLKKFAGTKEEFVKMIDADNMQVSERNKERIIRYSLLALRHVEALQTEKDLFLEYIKKVDQATENFKYTFTEDLNDSDIVKMSGSGASGLKYTRFTVAGFRACVNSYDSVFRTELTRLANIQKREKEQKRIKEQKTAKIKELLSSGMTLEDVLQAVL